MKELLQTKVVDEDTVNINFLGYTATANLNYRDVDENGDTEEEWQVEIPCSAFGDYYEGGTCRDFNCKSDSGSSYAYLTYSADDDYHDYLQDELKDVTLALLADHPPISHQYFWNIDFVDENGEFHQEEWIEQQEYPYLEDILHYVYDEAKKYKGVFIGLMIHSDSPFAEEYTDSYPVEGETYWFANSGKYVFTQNNGKVVIYSDDQNIDTHNWVSRLIDDYGWTTPHTVKFEPALK